MQIRRDDADGIVILSAPNMDLDASNADEFKKSVSPAVQGETKVIFDLSTIGFMDSAGLGAVLSVFKKVRADGGQFKVYGLSEEVKSLFELVRMQRLFEVYPDRESAIRAFQQ